jgi:hypothetical protein
LLAGIAVGFSGVGGIQGFDLHKTVNYNAKFFDNTTNIDKICKNKDIGADEKKKKILKIVSSEFQEIAKLYNRKEAAKIIGKRLEGVLKKIAPGATKKDIKNEIDSMVRNITKMGQKIDIKKQIKQLKKGALLELRPQGSSLSSHEILSGVGLRKALEKPKIPVAKRYDPAEEVAKRLASLPQSVSQKDEVGIGSDLRQKAGEKPGQAHFMYGKSEIPESFYCYYTKPGEPDKVHKVDIEVNALEFTNAEGRKEIDYFCSWYPEEGNQKKEIRFSDFKFQGPDELK